VLFLEGVGLEGVGKGSISGDGGWGAAILTAALKSIPCAIKKRNVQYPIRNVQFPSIDVRLIHWRNVRKGCVGLAGVFHRAGKGAVQPVFQNIFL